MAPEASTQHELQEQSIKARKKELFVEDVATGPRKAFREYLSETPSAPLSKNVKLILWGSAAPVVLLFLGSVVTAKGSAPKAPQGTVLAPVAPEPQASPILPLTSTRPPEAAIASSRPTPVDAAREKPAEEPNKPKKPTDGKSSVANASDQPGTPGQGTKDDPKGASASQTAKDKADPNDKPGTGKDAADPKAGAADSTSSPSPEKAKRAPLFKKKKAPVFTYPKREGEKKDDKGDPSKAKPGSDSDPDASMR
jgi:hypothetical protein